MEIQASSFLLYYTLSPKTEVLAIGLDEAPRPSGLQALHISDFYHQLLAKYTLWEKEDPTVAALLELILSYY